MSSSEDYLDQLLKGVLDQTPAEEPAMEPVLDAPIFEEPVIEEPVIDEPVIDEPVIEEPVIEEPVIEELLIEDPIIDIPAIEEPAIEIPAEAPKKKSGRIAITDIPGLFNEDSIIENNNVEDSIVEDNNIDDIANEQMPVIDSAPSLEPAELEPVEDSVADLMADIMPSFDAGLDSASESSAERLEAESSESIFDTEVDAFNDIDVTNEFDNSNDIEVENINADLNSLLNEIENFDIDNRIDIDSFGLDENEIDSDFVDEEQTPAQEDLDSSEESSSDLDLDAIRAELEDVLGDELEESSEPDVEQMIAAAQNEAQDTGNLVISDTDLNSIIDASNDMDANDIGDMLDKADNNEAIDEGIAALLSTEPENMVPDFDNEEETLTPAQLKAKAKAEKAEAKRKAKEEKAEAKRKAKEEKALAKQRKKNKSNEENSSVEENTGDADATPVIETPEINENSADITDNNSSSEEDMSDVISLLENADFVSGNENIQDFNEELEITEDSIGFDEALLNEGLESIGLQDLAPDTDNSSDNVDTNSNEAEFNLEFNEDNAELEDIGEKKEGFFAKVKNFFSKIVSSISEEDDEEDEIILSDENKQILDEMNAEDGEAPKKKGKKPKKDKKGKSSEDGEEGAEAKPKKEKKPKKPKKEKPAEEKPSGKSIPKKKIFMVVLVCIMFAAVLFIITRFSGDFSVKMEARNAYKNEDYQTCYQDLFGKKLNESEQIMFNRSECILRIRLWLREYEVLAEEGSEVRALDSLIQSVNSYPGLYTSAEKWGCLDKVEPTYNEMLGILQNKYGLSAQEACEIAAEPDDVMYTKLVTAIANGNKYQDILQSIEEANNPKPVEEKETEPVISFTDKLPEEEGIEKGNFIEP